jgi:hypothetical protein
MTRRLAVGTYRWLPRTCKKLVVAGCASVASAATKCSWLPLPATAAYAIIYTQRVFPVCKACYHPVIIGRTHGKWCAEQRSMECSTLLHGYLAMLGGADVSIFCSGRSCQHPVPRRGLCDCCQQNVMPAQPGRIRSLLQALAFGISEHVLSPGRL